ncbi:MAG TPA: NfeD family protein [Verrucomicrobiae bacterium]|nr:NfeD family protein [Verrucomicrobiae bacterium]
MLIYAAIGAFGLLFLLVMLFVGEVFGDHEVHVEGGVGGHEALEHGPGPSILSARVIAAFLTAFGGGGVISRYYNLSHPASSGIGIACGIVLAGLVYQFARLLHSQQASSEIRMEGLIGRTAEVTVSIPKGGLGQVTVAAGGERSTQIARSADGGAIPVGTDVTITEMRGDSLVVARTGAPQAGGR